MYYYRLFVTCAIVLFSLFGTCLPTMKAQEKMVYVTHDDSTTQQKKSSLLIRFIRSFSALDTNYIQPNYYNYITMLQNTSTFDQYTMGLVDKHTGEQRQVSLHPTPSFRIGPYFGWRWLFIGYTFDVAHFTHATRKRDFTFSLYTASLGADFIWKQNSRAFTLYPGKRILTDWVRPNETYIFDGMNVSNITINAYYICNSRKFSYPAAFNQSTTQIKSAGSWMIGAKYANQKIEIDNTRLPSLHPREEQHVSQVLKYRAINYKNYSINVGYGYNWVFARHWLLAGSLMPSIGIKEVSTITSDISQERCKVRPNIDATIRLGLVWNNSKFFIGTSLISHVYNHHSADYRLHNSFTTFNLYVGFNFMRRKEYRKH